MLNVLLVDDEALARSGLKHSIGWERYGMRIAYEASCVDEAIALLREHEDIDLVFTDIVMPVKNGIELLRQINEERPTLPVAVLTYHNDFAFVREALRLGAVDYINKTELEQPAVDSALMRIERVARGREAEKLDGEGWKGSPYRQAVYIHSLQPIHLPEDFTSESLPVDESGTLYLASRAVSGEAVAALERQVGADEFILLIREADGIPVADLVYRTRMFLAQEYFYARLPSLRIYEIDGRCARASAVDSSTLRRIREELASFTWINDKVAFERVLEEISCALLPPAIVHDLFFGVQDKWQQVFGGGLTSVGNVAISDFTFWYQWVDWIAYIKQQLLMYGGFSRYSPEISGAVQRLLLRLNENPAACPNLAKAAALTNLSGSYFAKCFRNITSHTYTEYVRDLRMEYGRKLLIQTNLPVTRVAELCGLPDPFYFSKLFKRHFGRPPSAYRSAHEA